MTFRWAPTGSYSASGACMTTSAVAVLVSVPDIVSLPHPALGIGKQQPTNIPSVDRAVGHTAIVRGGACEFARHP